MSHHARDLLLVHLDEQQDVECTSTTKVGEYVAPTAKRCTRSSAQNYTTISASGLRSPSLSSHAPNANVPNERQLPELARAASRCSVAAGQGTREDGLEKDQAHVDRAGGVAATQDISMVPVTIRLLAEIAAHF